MADFETKLRWLSERGIPGGAEELIERIEADLAGDPLVVVPNRREGRPMTKTQSPPTTNQPSRYRGPVAAATAFLAVLAVAVVSLFFAGDDQPGDDRQVADSQPTPTTTQPAPTTAAPEGAIDLEVIEAAVAAFYSGDGERAAELFELSDRTDDAIRAEAAYQAAIGGRLSLKCTERDTATAVFTCRTPYHNTLTDAIGYTDSGDTSRVVVEDGVITEFGFPEHSFIVVQFGSFLAMEDRAAGYEDCLFGPFPEACATIQLENMDSWLEWRRSLQPANFVESLVESWYGGDCEEARYLSDLDPGACSTQDTAAQMIEYESILEAEVSVEGCETTAEIGDLMTLSCEIRYSNAMNVAAAEPDAVIVREFNVETTYGNVGSPDQGLWYLSEYPEDAELRESFRLFAEAGELTDEYAAADCASARTPECATLIMDNIDDWAGWHAANG